LPRAIVFLLCKLFFSFFTVCYYEWRSRSGCFFCFFQRREEWLGLAERHPKEFARAIEMEKQEGGKGYTWIQGMTLEELVERKDEILVVILSD
jgi:hypothetical protein